MFAEQWRWLPRKQIPAELNLPSSLQHISASPSHYNLLRVLQNIITIGMTPHKGRITALFNKAGVTVFQRNKQWAELWSWSKELFTRVLVFRFKCRTIWPHRVVSRHSWSHQDWHPSPMIRLWMELLWIKKCHFYSLCIWISWCSKSLPHKWSNSLFTDKSKEWDKTWRKCLDLTPQWGNPEIWWLFTISSCMQMYVCLIWEDASWITNCLLDRVIQSGTAVIILLGQRQSRHFFRPRLAIMGYVRGSDA